MNFTQFKKEDQAGVSNFWQSIFDEMGWPVKESDGFDNISRYIHLPDGFLFLIKDNEKVIGCGGVTPLNSKTGIVKRFYITRNLRGKGVSKKLLDRIIKESKKRGIKRLVLDVYFKNLRASKFYEKYGFTRYNQKPVAKWNQTLTPDKFFYYKLDITG